MQNVDILYIANIRLPTEKAHGVAIMKMCEAFVRAGARLELVVSRRFTTLAGDPFEIYDVKERFPIARLFVIDLFPLTWIRSRVAFALESATFYLSLFVWILPLSRNRVIYTRDIAAVACAFLGFKVVYECHAVAKRRGFFFLARRAHKVVVISQSLKQPFIEAGCKPEDIVVAPSGVDVRLFSSQASKSEMRAELGISKEHFVAVYTGSFTTMGADKGVYDIFDALALASNVYFVGVGAQPYDLVRYGQRAAELGIADRVRLVGYVPQRMVARYQRAADVLLMPYTSLHYRHHLSPMKMFEYMASGRPVIATDVPTVREVAGGDMALLVPPSNAPALSAALKRLQAEPTLGDAIAARAFTQVGQYSWDERAKRILKKLA